MDPIRRASRQGSSRDDHAAWPSCSRKREGNREARSGAFRNQRMNNLDPWHERKAAVPKACRAKEANFGARSAGLEPATFSVRSHSPSQTGIYSGGQGETKPRFYQVLALLEGQGGTGSDTRLWSDCGQNTRRTKGAIRQYERVAKFPILAFFLGRGV